MALIRTLLGMIVLVALGGCGTRSQAAEQQITITGSTSVGPFVEQLAERYNEMHPEQTINVQALGSSAGIQAATEGTAEIGMSSRQLKTDEATQLESIEIARDALVVIVHPRNPVASLSTEQVRAIFTGAIQNWREVGGNDAPVVVVTREAGSGTYSAFEELVMDEQLPAADALRQGSNGAVRQIVGGDPDAIGYISLGIVDQSVKPVAVDNVQASTDAVVQGRYKLVRPFLFVRRNDRQLSPLAQSFLEYVLSPEGQRELAQGGLIQGADAR